MHEYLWLIPLFPLVGFLINGLGWRTLPRKLTAWVQKTSHSSIFRNRHPLVRKEPLPKPSARKKVARKPRPRKKPSKPVEAAPTATGLPGHIKILTKGHTVEIYEGATLLGRAPGLLTLPAGRHRLRLKSMESGESLTLPVTVVANATKTISLDLD